MFEVNVTNDLETETIFVKIRSEYDKECKQEAPSSSRSSLNNLRPAQPANFHQNGYGQIPTMVDSQHHALSPGFVCIQSCQTLPFPVITKQKHKDGAPVLYATVFVENLPSSNLSCLANQFQINRDIKIRRNETNKIVLEIVSYDEKIELLLTSWSIPKYLSSSLINQGWTDPSLWKEINDEDFKELGFKKGHIATFKHRVKNNDLRQHQIENRIEGKIMQHAKKTDSDSKTDEMSTMAMNEKNLKTKTRKNLLQNMQKFDKDAPQFYIDENTISHEQFWYKLLTMKESEHYFLETRMGEQNDGIFNGWTQIEKITNTKSRNIYNLRWNTTYSVRVKAVNKKERTTKYSKIITIKTHDAKWKEVNLPEMPHLSYSVSSNNQKIVVEFDEFELDKLKQTKFDERYFLDIGLSNDISLSDGKVNWKTVAALRKDKLIYVYNVNKQKNAQMIYVGISARNDLGKRYNQCSKTRKFPFNQVVKQINTTHHGKNLQFDETGKRATKIDQDYQYSTFVFGAPITNKMCNRYDMYVKVNKLQKDCFIGYAANEQGIKDWNQPFGYGSNKNSSVGVLANKKNMFAVYNKDHQQFVNLPVAVQKEENEWEDGSIFLLSFDFENDDINIYQNKNEPDQVTSAKFHRAKEQNVLLKSVKINNNLYQNSSGKSVLPSFSLNCKGDSVEVLKWRLY